MALTNKGLLFQANNYIGGVQRIYRFGLYGLSLINSPYAHFYPFAWEVAVIRFTGGADWQYTLDFSTPLTSSVEVFKTTKATNDFIKKAENLFSKN